MPFQVIPREQTFFPLFERSAENVAEGAHELAALTRDLEHAEAHSERIHEIEHEGDELVRQIMATLNVTFVTPFERQDIYGLATGLDDILDAEWAAADLLVLHQIDEPLPEVQQLASVLVRVTDVVVETVARLRTLRELNGYLVEINRLENEGDRLYRKTVADLFSGDYKAMDVLKWKDVIENLEDAVDGLENVADVIESTVLKHA